MTVFLRDLCVHFEPLLGWGFADICLDLKTKKEGICVKKQEYERSKCHIGEGHLEN